jgi:hypothetical protein
MILLGRWIDLSADRESNVSSRIAVIEPERKCNPNCVLFSLYFEIEMNHGPR